MYGSNHLKTVEKYFQKWRSTIEFSLLKQQVNPASRPFTKKKQKTMIRFHFLLSSALTPLSREVFFEFEKRNEWVTTDTRLTPTLFPPSLGSYTVTMPHSIYNPASYISKGIGLFVSLSLMFVSLAKAHTYTHQVCLWGNPKRVYIPPDQQKATALSRKAQGSREGNFTSFYGSFRSTFWCALTGKSSSFTSDWQAVSIGQWVSKNADFYWVTTTHKYPQITRQPDICVRYV